MDAVRAAHLERYSSSVDTTRWWLDEERLCVEGEVLVTRQAHDYIQALRAWAPVPSPAVLTDPDCPWTRLRWARLERGVDLHRGAEGEALQTQWPADAWVRRFVDRDARCLVQLPDTTVGWVASDALQTATPDADPWADTRRGAAGEARAGGSLAAAAQAARERLGRPYLWGGNTSAAADCSGFVQSLLRDHGDLLLPKHTADQLRLGQRVAAADARPGDLLFVRGKERRVRHVGLVLASTEHPGERTVIHSCMSRRRVVEETIDDFQERYTFQGCRRPVEWRP